MRKTVSTCHSTRDDSGMDPMQSAEAASTLEEDMAVLRSIGVTMQQLANTDAETIRRSAAAVPAKKCCLCGETFRGWGNNPSPVLEGREGAAACDDCNAAIVLPQRARIGRRGGASITRSVA